MMLPMDVATRMGPAILADADAAAAGFAAHARGRADLHRTRHIAQRDDAAGLLDDDLAAARIAVTAPPAVPMWTPPPPVCACTVPPASRATISPPFVSSTASPPTVVHGDLARAVVQRRAPPTCPT